VVSLQATIPLVVANQAVLGKPEEVGRKADVVSGPVPDDARNNGLIAWDGRTNVHSSNFSPI
jgi:hypothetical protein